MSDTVPVTSTVLDPATADPGPGEPRARGESRWPMALAIVAAAILRFTLPHQLRLPGSVWLLPIVTVFLLAAVIATDPGRIDRQSPLTRLLTDGLIALVTIVNAGSAVKLIAYLLGTGQFNNATVLLQSGGVIWFTNVIAFGLWYWDLDRGGAAARVSSSDAQPAFVFPEMSNQEYVAEGWTPKFIDYLHLSFTTATAFSPTDVSAIKPWAKLLMMAEESISLILAVLVVARAVNILQ